MVAPFLKSMNNTNGEADRTGRGGGGDGTEILEWRDHRDKLQTSRRLGVMLCPPRFDLSHVSVFEISCVCVCMLVCTC